MVVPFAFRACKIDIPRAWAMQLSAAGTSVTKLISHILACPRIVRGRRRRGSLGRGADCELGEHGAAPDVAIELAEPAGGHVVAIVEETVMAGIPHEPQL